MEYDDLEIKIAMYYMLVLSKNHWSKPACVYTRILEYQYSGILVI